MAADNPEVSGFIDSIEQGLARVLIGRDEEEWFFPVEMLPENADVGSELYFEVVDGRYNPIGIAGGRSIEGRLTNPLLLKRTRDFRASDFRREIEDD